ncbi:MAG: hypothetical protein KJ674_01200 [Nanoarchaeota archaeon]|nr:hypothetical protein [Nanoarchaeota archaeon]
MEIDISWLRFNMGEENAIGTDYYNLKRGSLTDVLALLEESQDEDHSGPGRVFLGPDGLYILGQFDGGYYPSARIVLGSVINQKPNEMYLQGIKPEFEFVEDESLDLLKILSEYIKHEPCS